MRVQKVFCARTTKSEATERPPKSFSTMSSSDCDPLLVRGRDHELRFFESFLVEKNCVEVLLDRLVDFLVGLISKGLPISVVLHLFKILIRSDDCTLFARFLWLVLPKYFAAFAPCTYDCYDRACPPLQPCLRGLFLTTIRQSSPITGKEYAKHGPSGSGPPNLRKWKRGLD